MWLVGMQNNMAILEKFQFLTKPSTTDKAHNVASTPLILYLGKKIKFTNIHRSCMSSSLRLETMKMTLIGEFHDFQKLYLVS